MTILGLPCYPFLYNENIFIIIEPHGVGSHTQTQKSKWLPAHILPLNGSISGQSSILLALFLASSPPRNKATFIYQANIIMSLSAQLPYPFPARFFVVSFILATDSQQNGLKNVRGAKHLWHVFNNVVYNVYFSSILFPPLSSWFFAFPISFLFDVCS